MCGQDTWYHTPQHTPSVCKIIKLTFLIGLRIKLWTIFFCGLAEFLLNQKRSTFFLNKRLLSFTFSNILNGAREQILLVLTNYCWRGLKSNIVGPRTLPIAVNHGLKTVRPPFPKSLVLTFDHPWIIHVICFTISRYFMFFHNLLHLKPKVIEKKNFKHTKYLKV